MEDIKKEERKEEETKEEEVVEPRKELEPDERKELEELRKEKESVQRKGKELDIITKLSGVAEEVGLKREFLDFFVHDRVDKFNNVKDNKELISLLRQEKASPESKRFFELEKTNNKQGWEKTTERDKYDDDEDYVEGTSVKKKGRY